MLIIHLVILHSNQRMKTMENYEYIMAKCREFRSKQWDEEELRKCIGLLKSLTREELLRVYSSRFLLEKHPLRETVFKTLFADKIGKREERIRTMPVDELITEFEDKKSGNVALIRKEMRDRYKRNKGEEKHKITIAFNKSTKGDQQWIKSQERKAEYERIYGKPYPEWKPWGNPR